jgi:hypothetical protein
LEQEDAIKIKIESICIESISVKEHPDWIGELKKREPKNRAFGFEDLEQRYTW